MSIDREVNRLLYSMLDVPTMRIWEIYILQLQSKIAGNKVIYDYESRCALRSVKRDIRTPLLAVFTNTILKVQIGVISSRVALEHGIKPRLLEKDTHSILPHSLRT